MHVSNFNSVRGRTWMVLIHVQCMIGLWSTFESSVNPLHDRFSLFHPTTNLE